MESKSQTADRLIHILKDIANKKNVKVGATAKKNDGSEFVKVGEKEINELCLTAQDILANQPVFLEL